MKFYKFMACAWFVLAILSAFVRSKFDLGCAQLMLSYLSCLVVRLLLGIEERDARILELAAAAKRYIEVTTRRPPQ